MTMLYALNLALYGLAGLALGAASLTALRFNTALYLSGRLWGSLGLHTARLVIVAGLLVWAARQGAGPLVAIAAGLVLARPIAIRTLGRAR